MLKYMLEQDTDNSGTLDFEEFKVHLPKNASLFFVFFDRVFFIKILFNFDQNLFSIFTGGYQDCTEETAGFGQPGLKTQHSNLLFRLNKVTKESINFCEQ